jgi:hypothetical protein
MDLVLVPKAAKPLHDLKTLTKASGDLKFRDKWLRFAQYLAKFLVFRLVQADPKSDLGKRLNELSKGIGLHRKAFKLGAFVDEIQKFQETLESGKTDAKATLTLLMRPALALFTLLDNMVWLASLKFTQWDKDSLKMSSYRARLVAAYAALAINVLDYQKGAKAVAAAKPEEKQKAEEAQGQLVVSLVKNGADVVTYMNSCNLLALTDGNAGLVGALSSAAAMYNLWVKY